MFLISLSILERPRPETPGPSSPRIYLWSLLPSPHLPVPVISRPLAQSTLDTTAPTKAHLLQVGNIYLYTKIGPAKHYIKYLIILFLFFNPTYSNYLKDMIAMGDFFEF